MSRNQWIICPICNGKTRVMIRENTVIKNLPLFCPKCKQETLVDIKQFKVTTIKETKSR